ncbi:hypothetical protein [Streptomyces spinosus]|uniref:hypothetical protein n=1 Tax=Streptomyces spinosus TaxID=2872623 RepID=UPI001CED6B37|nr:hypothetical protein [Streptomyces spinosus]
MTKKDPGAALVAGWGLFNGLLAAVLVIYHGHLIAVMLYVGAVVLIGLAAVAVLVSARRNPQGQVDQRLAVRGAATLPLMAVGLTLALLTLVYGPWMLSLSVPLLLVAVAVAIHRGAWRKGGSS